jgi:hypothetical protein
VDTEGRCGGSPPARTPQGLSFEASAVGNNEDMVLLLVLLIVLIFAGAGFALHILWIAAVIFALFWLIGAALGRGESSGRHRFYRW